MIRNRLDETVLYKIEKIVPLASHQLEKATRSLMIIAQISLLILQERVDGTMDISKPGPITRN